MYGSVYKGVCIICCSTQVLYMKLKSRKLTFLNLSLSPSTDGLQDLWAMSEIWVGRLSLYPLLLFDIAGSHTEIHFLKWHFFFTIYLTLFFVFDVGRPEEQDDSENSTIYITGLSDKANLEEMAEFFKHVGPIRVSLVIHSVC